MSLADRRSGRAKELTPRTTKTSYRCRFGVARSPARDRTRPGRRIAGIALLLALIAVIPARAQEAAERTLSPYFLVEGGDSGTDRLPLLGTEVTVRVAGVIADVTVRQTYKNAGARPIHARYVFPASTRAAVHGLRMVIGEHVIEARIRERETAKREYQEAKRAGKNAALLEQQRPNVFTMDVANVVPGQTIDVELRYTELLVPVAGVYEFVYPTVVGPRYSNLRAGTASESDRWIRSPYTRQGEPPRASLRLSGTVGAGMPIRDLACPSHAITPEWEDPARVRFALEPADSAGGNRDFVLRYRLEGDAIQTGLMLHRSPGESFFLATIQPPLRITSNQVPPRDYVFVVDVSGSMAGFPLATSKALLSDLIGHLRPTDTFNVITFAGGSEVWAPRSMPATPENVSAAVALLDRQTGGGGTELLAALNRALRLPGDGPERARSLVIVTDGYIATEKEVFATIRENLGRSNVFAFGIGSSVNRHLIEGIARAGRSEPFVVLDPVRAPEHAARFREYVQYPLLTGVQVAFEGFEAYDVEPRAIPDVLADRPVVIQGKWRGAPRGRVVVTGTTGAGAFRQALEVSGDAVDEANGALRYLWARTRIADLSDFGGRDEAEEEERELVSLGLTYGLLTRYTSFVAVHEVIRNPSGAGEQVAQPLPLPQGVTDAAVGGVGVGSEPGLVLLLAVAFGLALVAVLGRRAAATSVRSR